MNMRAMRAIMRKDLKVVRQSSGVMIPLIIVPLVFLVAIPGIGGLVLANVQLDSQSIQDFRDDSAAFFDNLPDPINERLEKFDNEVQRMTYIMFNMFFPALYLLLPIMVANVIAADSFVGEKERKTLEALLYTPVTDREFYFAKIGGSWAAAVAVGWLGYLAFTIVVTATTYSLMGEAFVLNLTWLLLILWVVPAVSGLGLAAIVLISSRVSTFQEAQQLGSVIVLPLLVLLFGQIFGILYFTPSFVVLIGALIWLFTLVLIWYGAKSFQRSELIARL